MEGCQELIISTQVRTYQGRELAGKLGTPFCKNDCWDAGVAGKSFSHHHRHSAWQRAELHRVYGQTGMTGMEWVTGADGDTGVTEMDGATWSIYSQHPGVDSLSSHFRPSYHSMNYTLYLSNLLISVVLPGIRKSMQLSGSMGPGRIISSHPLPTFLEPVPDFLMDSLWMW